MAISPRNRAKAQAEREVRALSNEYFVYDDKLAQVGGHVVVEHDGKRKVKMHPQAAVYWIDQGVIGMQAADEGSAEARNARAQFRRMPVDKQGGAAKPRAKAEAPAKEAAKK